MYVLGEDTWESLTDNKIADMILSWGKLLDLFIHSRQAGDVYLKGGNWLDAFCRTVLGDLVMAEFPISRAADACHLEVLDSSKTKRRMIYIDYFVIWSSTRRSLSRIVDILA